MESSRLGGYRRNVASVLFVNECYGGCAIDIDSLGGLPPAEETLTFISKQPEKINRCLALSIKKNGYICSVTIKQ